MAIGSHIESVCFFLTQQDYLLACYNLILMKDEVLPPSCLFIQYIFIDIYIYMYLGVCLI